MAGGVSKTLAAAGLLTLCVGPGCYSGLDGEAGSIGGESAGADGADDGADGGADGGDDGADGGPDGVPDDFEPSPGSMRRLTAAQYRNSIRDVFGLDIEEDLGVPVELDLDEESAIFRSIGASYVGTSPSGVEKYRDAAFAIANAVFADPDSQPWLAGCVPTSGNDACVRDAIVTVGTRLWRRPLDADEVDRYAALVDAPFEDGVDPQLGLQYAIAALIESPNFVYLPIVGEDVGGLRRYTGFEMASRLSYTLWNTTPDDALLESAAAGELVSREGVEDQARRMLEDERAADVLVRFFGEAWNVDRIAVEHKHPEAFPGWDQALLDSFQTEFALVLRDHFEGDADARSLFDASTTWASPELAQWYGLTPGDPAAAQDGFSPVELGEQRHGLLTTGAVLAANSPSDRSSPVVRGVFVLERLLCGDAPPPPADVDDVLPEDDGEPKSTRQKLEEHRENPSCASCHALIDPLGLVLEHYDGIGQWREDENGFPIDPSGEYEGTTFDAAEDLAAFLADDPRAMTCIARHALSYATGRELGTQDAPAIAELVATFTDSDYQMRELMVAVTTNAAFRYMTSDPATRIKGEQP